MLEAIADNLVFLSLIGMAGVGWITEQVTRSRREKRREARDAQIARCACTHVFSAHALAEPHACTADVKREHYEKNGDRQGHEYVPCPCKRYDGPVPIESWFQPPKPLHLPRGDA